MQCARCMLSTPFRASYRRRLNSACSDVETAISPVPAHVMQPWVCKKHKPGDVVGWLVSNFSICRRLCSHQTFPAHKLSALCRKACKRVWAHTCLEENDQGRCYSRPLTSAGAETTIWSQSSPTASWTSGLSSRCILRKECKSEGAWVSGILAPYISHPSACMLPKCHTREQQEQCWALQH